MSVFEPVMNSELGEAEGLLAAADGVVLSGQWRSSSKELITRPPASPRLLPICHFPLVLFVWRQADVVAPSDGAAPALGLAAASPLS